MKLQVYIIEDNANFIHGWGFILLKFGICGRDYNPPPGVLRVWNGLFYEVVFDMFIRCPKFIFLNISKQHTKISPCINLQYINGTYTVWELGFWGEEKTLWKML